MRKIESTLVMQNRGFVFHYQHKNIFLSTLNLTKFIRNAIQNTNEIFSGYQLSKMLMILIIKYYPLKNALIKLIVEQQNCIYLYVIFY